MLPMMLMQLFELMVAVTRVQNYINLPETESKRSTSGSDGSTSGSIKVKNGNFKWDLESSDNSLHDINIEVKPGELNYSRTKKMKLTESKFFKNFLTSIALTN